MLNNIIRNNDGSYSPIGNYKHLKTNAGCSKIYKSDNVLKIYYSHIPNYLRITEEIFKTLKDIDESNFIKLEDYYLEGKIVGYTTEYIKNEKDFNFLEKDYAYIEYNLRKIEKLILLFTKLGIVIEDVNYRNYLGNSDEIVLIDPDCYRFVEEVDSYTLYKEGLLVVNYKKMLGSFVDLFVKSFYKDFSKYKIGSAEFNKIIFEIFKYDGTRDSLTSSLEKLKESNIMSMRA